MWANKKEKGLFLSILTRFPNKEVRRIQYLVDTGSEVNLINPAVVPKECWQRASETHDLVGADNRAIKGGHWECTVQLIFFGLGMDDKIPTPEQRIFFTNFFDGNVEVKGIL